MQASQNGIDLIKTEEGLRLKPYSDICGKSTIGYGHLILRRESFPAGISEETAEHILADDVAEAESIVAREVTVELTQGEFDALTDFCFNLGDRLRGSTLLRFLNAGDYASAEAHLADWVMAGGRENAGLKARRLLEMEIWAKAAPDPEATS